MTHHLEGTPIGFKAIYQKQWQPEESGIINSKCLQKTVNQESYIEQRYLSKLKAK